MIEFHVLLLPAEVVCSLSSPDFRWISSFRILHIPEAMSNLARVWGGFHNSNLDAYFLGYSTKASRTTVQKLANFLIKQGREIMSHTQPFTRCYYGLHCTRRGGESDLSCHCAANHESLKDFSKLSQDILSIFWIHFFPHLCFAYQFVVVVIKLFIFALNGILEIRVIYPQVFNTVS